MAAQSADVAGGRAPNGDGPSSRAGIAMLIVAGIFAFLAAVGIVIVLNVAGLTPCDDVTEQSQLRDGNECFDGSGTQRTLALVLGWPGVVLAALTALSALWFLQTSRRPRLPVYLGVPAVALLLASFVFSAI